MERASGSDEARKCFLTIHGSSLHFLRDLKNLAHTGLFPGVDQHLVCYLCTQHTVEQEWSLSSCAEILLERVINAVFVVKGRYPHQKAVEVCCLL